MDPELVRQQQQAEREALQSYSLALPQAGGSFGQARPGRAFSFLAAERFAQPVPESLSVVTEQFDRISRTPLSALNLMAGLGMAAAQYVNFFAQMAGAMLFGPANLFLAPRSMPPFGMAAPMPWWPRV